MFSSKNLSYYNERHHDKGPMDGVDSTVNHMVLQIVK